MYIHIYVYTSSSLYIYIYMYTYRWRDTSELAYQVARNEGRRQSAMPFKKKNRSGCLRYTSAWISERATAQAVQYNETTTFKYSSETEWWVSTELVEPEETVRKGIISSRGCAMPELPFITR